MRILFTCAFLDGYHGSVMLVKEHAEYLASKKGGSHDVTVATILATPEITNFFTSCGVAVRHLPDVDVAVHYDIVFAYHYPTLDNLLERGMHCEKLVMGSLSSFEKLESFPQYWDTASLLIVMSRETKEVHHCKYGIPREKMLVFENTIPDAFAEYAISCPSPFPCRIAVVSNHIPREVEELPVHLPENCKFTMVGVGREICEAVTPKLLSRFDVVISIGKTVQYAMALGIPIFEYDYFGGNGYVTPETLAKEAENNFSGRPKKRKLTSPALAAEIMEGYASAREQAPALRELALERFLLSKKMDELLKIINNSNKFSCVSGGGNLSLAHGSCFCSWVGTWKQRAMQAEAFIASMQGSHGQSQFKLFRNVGRVEELEQKCRRLKAKKHKYKVIASVAGAALALSVGLHLCMLCF